MGGISNTAKILLVFLSSYLGIVFVYASPTFADDTPSASVVIISGAPISSEQVTFAITATDDRAINISTLRFLVDENNDGVFTSQPCASNPCVITKGPYSPGQTVNYYATVRDDADQLGNSLPYNSFTIFELSVEHTPEYPDSSAQVTFEATVAGGVDIAQDGLRILIDESATTPGFEFVHQCSSSPCQTTRTYSPGQAIKYYAEATDTSDNYATTLRPQDKYPARSFTIFSPLVSTNPQTPKASDQVLFTATVDQSVKNMQEIKLFIDELPSNGAPDGIFETQTPCFDAKTCTYTKIDIDKDGIYYSPGKIIRYYMTARDSAGSIVETLIQEFTVLPPDILPVANFSPSISGFDITLNDTSNPGSSPITSWSWNLGDGKTASGKNPPTHTYDTSKSYNISLTVTNTVGSHTQTKAIEVTQGGIPDSRSPRVDIISPEYASVYNTDLSSFNVRYRTTDNRGVTSCRLSTKNGSNGWNPSNPSAGATIPCGEDVETTITSTHCSSHGTNACGVRIWAEDGQGLSSYDERFFSIDLEPPILSISSSRSNPTQKTDVTFKIYTSDPYGIFSVECDLDTPISRSLQDCHTLEKSFSNIEPDGIHTFYVKITDIAGNTAEKSITWEIDSTPPSLIESLIAFDQTYFSNWLSWFSPTEHEALTSSDVPASQYDIRYAFRPITYSGWDEQTAIIFDEHNRIPPKDQDNPDPPRPQNQLEEMLVGPQNESSIAGLKLGGIENLLSSYIDHNFAIRSRDDAWNWSEISNIFNIWTRRDPCDYDADRAPTANGCGPRVCNPLYQTCDIYDNPDDWHLAEEDPDPYDWQTPGYWPRHKADDFWIKAFGASSDDLDMDGEGVATTRTGLEVDTGTPVPIVATPKDKDWYDNPFTEDFYSLAQRPLLNELSHTINDLDLDTFISLDWLKQFGGSFFVDSNFQESIEADFVFTPTGDENYAGCFSPASTEDRCINCTAYRYNPVTGRVPPSKNAPTTDEGRAVCQIEAYYTDLTGANPPYEVIPTAGAPKGTIDVSRSFLTASAQCRDTLDNDLDGLTDSGLTDQHDPMCPKDWEFSLNKAQDRRMANANYSLFSTNKAAIFPEEGIVQCGRYADDYTTPTVESAPCNLCSAFQLIDNLLSLFVSRIFLLLIVIAVAIGGVLMILSQGNADRYKRGKEIIKKSILVYIAILISWLLLNFIFGAVGVASWTGFTPVRGSVSSISLSSLTDTNASWSTDQWKDYAVEITAPDEQNAIIKIAGNDSTTLFLLDDQPFIMNVGQVYKYHILGTGWWSFVCELGEGRPTADFSIAPTGGIAPFFADFTDLSLGGITKWNWQFGDGSESTEQSPMHQYTSDGPHQITLKVTSAGGTDSITKTVYHAPTAEFIVLNPHGTVPFTAEFRDLSKGQIRSWNWDFDGDGQQDSGAQNPSFTFTKPGPYRVNLTVKGPGGHDSESKLNYVFAYPRPPRPQAKFTANTAIEDNTPAIDDGVLLFGEFTNQSLYPDGESTLDEITGWNWDFANNFGTSAVESPSYYFDTKTTPHAVKLIAVGAKDSSEPATYPISFEPHAYFSAENVFAVLSSSGTATFQFHDNSIGTVNAWGWDFGDGNTACCDDPNPSHTYSKDGKFDVTLEARGPAGVSTKTLSGYIAIAPRANFSFKPPVLLSDSSPVGPNDCLSSDGCTVGANGARVAFNNTTICPSGACSWYWEFGDGKKSSSPSNNYEINESYSPRLIATGAGGSNRAIIDSYIYISPYAEFSSASGQAGPPSTTASQSPRRIFYGVGSGAVSFSNDSKVNILDLPDGWNWDFGDGGTSSQRNPSHTYSANPGCYPVTLDITPKAQAPGGIDTEIKENYVSFKLRAAISPPSASFSRSITIGCNDSVPEFCKSQTFSDVSTPHSTPHSHSWGGESITLTACANSTQSTTLTVTNQCGDSDSATATLSVSQSVRRRPCPPPPSAGP